MNWRARPQALGLTWTRLALVAAAFICVYFGFAIVGNRVHQYQLDRQDAQLEQQLQHEQRNNAQLQAIRTWMQSDNFVEQAARQQGMVMPGDHPLRVAAPSATPAAGGISDGWWQKYLTP